MMIFGKKTKAQRKTVIYCIFFICAALIIIDKLGFTRKVLLRVYEPIETAKVVLCEGWLPTYYIDTVISIFNAKPYEKLIVTDITNSKYVNLPENGKLYITDTNLFNKLAHPYKRNLTLSLIGSKANKEYTKVNIFINDSIVFDTIELVNEKIIKFEAFLSKEDTIIIEFVNDFYDGVHDRNLYLSSLQIDNQEIKIHSDKVWLKYRGRFFNTETQFYPRNLFKYLLTQDNENQKVEFVYSETYGISKTFNTAHGAVKWLKEKGYNSVNIVTLDFHSRRTYLTYKKIDPELNIGIIPIQNTSNQAGIFSKARTLKEIFGCLFIYLTPKKVLEYKVRGRNK